MRSVTIYGGVNINTQIQKLKRGAEIVVACPGRLLDHMGRGTIDLSRVEVLVLDEADHMLDMGFLPDIRRILKHLPAQRQTLLFSATMPKEIHRLAKDILMDPITIKAGETAPAETVSHAHYPVAQHLKTAFLLKLLGHITPNPCWCSRAPNTVPSAWENNWPGPVSIPPRCRGIFPRDVVRPLLTASATEDFRCW